MELFTFWEEYFWGHFNKGASKLLSIDNPIDMDEFNYDVDENLLPTRKKKRKAVKYFIGILLIAMLAGSYFIPEFEDQTTTMILIMFLRSIVILFLWFTFIGPFLRKLLNNYTAKKKNQYADEIERIIDSMPLYRKYAVYSWKKSGQYAGFKKIKTFFKLLFGMLLLESKA